jgi:transposase
MPSPILPICASVFWWPMSTAKAVRWAIAHRFRVCPATVCHWIRQARQDARRRPNSHRGGPAGRLGPPELSLLQELVAETDDARLDQYAERLFTLTGKRVRRA